MGCGCLAVGAAVSDVRPLPPGPLLHDEDGEPLPQPAENSDVRDFIALLEWARAKGFELAGAVRVGKIAVQSVADARSEKRRARADLPDPGVWAEHGYTPGDEE